MLCYANLRSLSIGYRLTQDELNAVYERFLTVADRKKEVFDEDLRALMNAQMVHIPETFKLEHLAISSVSGETPHASVRLRVRVGFPHISSV